MQDHHSNTLLMRRVALYAAAGLLLTTATAAVAQSCRFVSTGSSAIAFPLLDPSQATNQSANTVVRMDCTPASLVPAWTFAGAYGNAPLRMKHASLNAFIPYSVTAQSVGGNPNNRPWQITATVLGVNYQNAAAGPYSDVLVASINP
jgi:hypothetical protein